MTNDDRVQKRVLGLYKKIYGRSESDEQILSVDPNSFDMEPVAFYDGVSDAFPTADLEDVLKSGGTVAQVIAAINTSLKPAKKTPEKVSKNKDWLDLYFEDLRGRAGRKKTTKDEQVYTVLNFVYRHRARGRRGLLAQAEAIQLSNLEPYVKQAFERRLSFSAEQIADVLNAIRIYGVEYPPAYPPLSE